MAQDSNVNLKWDAHQATLKSVFDTLLDTESLADCTVGAEGQHLKAHKVILSAYSLYFELLFRHHHGKHIVIILPGAQFHILKALIQFMYRGEILIQQDELDALLKLADFLQVKGLSYGGNAVSENKQTHKRRNKSPTYSQHMASHCHVSPERDERSDSLELFEVSGGSPQSERSKEHDYTKVTSISTPARKRKKSERRASGEDASPQQDLVSPWHVISHQFPLDRPEAPDKNASSRDMFSDLAASSSTTSQLPIFSEGNFSAVTVSGHELISAKPFNSVVKASISPTVSEKTTILDTFTEPKQEKCSDFNQDDVCVDGDDTQCQNLCDDKSVAISEVTQSSFCDVESFAQQIQFQEAEWTNTGSGHQTSPTTRQFKCMSCDRLYPIYECGKEPQFQCPQCLFRLKLKNNLKKHMARHNL